MSLENFPQIIGQWHKDSHGNQVLLDVYEELYVNPISKQIQLSGIPDEFNDIQIEGFTQCYDLDEIHEKEFKVISWNDRRIQFNATQEGKLIKVRYKSKGVEYLSAKSILTWVDDRGEAFETLEELLKRCTDEIKLINTLGNAVIIIKKLERDIETARVLDESLESNIEIAIPLDDSLKEIVPQAQVVEPKLKAENTEANRILPLLEKEVDSGNILLPLLEEAVNNAEDVKNVVTATGNKSITITSAMWGTVQSDGFYHYTWNHKLATQSVMIDSYESTPNGLEFAKIGGIIKDNNNIELLSDVANDTTVVANARYYGGIIASLNTFSTDDLTEGVGNKYIKSYTTNVAANSFTLANDGLYEATVTHGLNRTKFSSKLGFINGKAVYIDIDEISPTQVKVVNNVAENIEIKLQWNGGV